MTQKQLDAYKAKIRLLKQSGVDVAREEKEISCRQTINSCLCYGTNFFEKFRHWVWPNGYAFESYADSYIKDLGEETVKRLYNEQKADFAKATVVKDVVTDSEGVSYNSIIWEDEKK